MNTTRLLLAATTLGLLMTASTASAADSVPPPHVVAGPEERGRVHVQVDGDALYGIGGQSFLGGDLRLLVDTAVWRTKHATGTLGGGLSLVYHNEPTFLAPWIDRDQVHGATHRVQTLAVAAHTIHMGAQRRFALGFQLQGGWNYWRSDYRVDYDRERLAGHSVVDRNTFVVGGQLRASYRVSRRIGINMELGGPFPTKSSYVNGMFQVGVGLTIHLR